MGLLRSLALLVTAIAGHLAAAEEMSASPALKVDAEHGFGLTGSLSGRGRLGHDVELTAAQKDQLAQLISEGGFYRLSIANKNSRPIMASLRAVSACCPPWCT